MSQDKRKLIILAQSLEQPRIIKRIIEKSLEYKVVHVYGFKREIHSVNNFSVLNDYDNISLSIAGNMSNSKYLSRIFCYLRLLVKVYANMGLRQKHLYTFGLDLRILSVLLINKKIDYEISDILWLYKKGFIKKILRGIDLFLAGKSNNVIFTSKGFYERYYKDSVHIDKVVIKENKFKSYGKVLPIQKIKTDGIKIAYIGAFRYNDIINNLLKTVAQNKNLILNFYGDGHNKSIINAVIESAKKYDNISFNGAFKNPDDLERIYSENNINFVVYDNSQENERVAMPNKFYESGFFNIPIVCAEKTYVGKRVLEEQMGWTIGTSYEEISDFFNKLNVEELLKYHKKIMDLNKSKFQL